MEKHYSFRNRTNDKLVKPPGSVQGQPIEISNCSQCEIQVLDYCDQVQIDDVKDSKIFIGASSESIFTRNCKNCSFTIACKQLRVRDCENCTFYLYCKTEPVIETSSALKLANFNGAYPGHKQAMINAHLDPKCNLWFSVYDFSDTEQTGEHWSYVEADHEEPLWCPLGPEINCCPRIEPGFTYLENGDKKSPFHHFKQLFIQFSDGISIRIQSLFQTVVEKYKLRSSNDALPDETSIKHIEVCKENTFSSLSLCSWKAKIWMRLTNLTSFFKFSNTQQDDVKKHEDYLVDDLSHESFEEYDDTSSSKSSLTSNTKNNLNRLIDQGYWLELIGFLGTHIKEKKEVKPGKPI